MTGPGNDLIESPPGFDFIDGKGGTDTVSYRARTESVVLTLAGSTPSKAYVGGVAEDTVVNVERISGGQGDDILTGDSRNNVLNGYLGDDVLRGGAGRDELNGGEGSDFADYRDKTEGISLKLSGATFSIVRVGGVDEDKIRNIENVYGGSGNDVIRGDGGANRISGGAGDDVLFGFDGDDRLSGGEGDDILRGGRGNDLLDGGAGFDTADYSDSNAALTISLNPSFQPNATVFHGGVELEEIRRIERITAGGGDDILAAANMRRDDPDDDDWISPPLVLEGGGGDDTLTAWSPQVKLYGGSGDDTLFVGGSFQLGNDGESGVYFIDGGDGVDTVTLYGSSERTFRLAGVESAFDIRNVENLTGSSGNDTLYGDDKSNIVNGAGGDDILYGGGGSDILDGGVGNDIASYTNQAGAITVRFSSGDSLVYINGTAEDTLRNIEGVYGGAGDDVFMIDAGLLISNSTQPIVISGGSGYDTLDLSDTLGVTMSAVTKLPHPIYGSITAVTMRFADSDVAIRLYDAEEIKGSAHGDHLIGMHSQNVLIGEGGDDYLVAYDGSTTLTGGEGWDTFAFAAPRGMAHITDFEPLESIALSRAGFTGFKDALLGAINANAILIGDGALTATTAAHRIIYDTADGSLYYDRDGVGGRAAIKFAVIDGAPTLTSADFLLVA